MRTGRIIAAFLLLSLAIAAPPMPLAAGEPAQGEVVVLTKRLPRHAVLSEADIEIVRRELDGIGSEPVASMDAALGKRLRATIQAGVALTSGMLEDAPLVKRGDLVTIVAESGDFRVTTLGEARSAGARNEVVRVKNLTSRREIFARVVAGGTVMVDL